MNRINIDGIEYDLVPSGKANFWTDELVASFAIHYHFRHVGDKDHHLSNEKEAQAVLSEWKDCKASKSIPSGKGTANDVLNTEDGERKIVSPEDLRKAYHNDLRDADKWNNGKERIKVWNLSMGSVYEYGSVHYNLDVSEIVPQEELKLIKTAIEKIINHE